MINEIAKSGVSPSIQSIMARKLVDVHNQITNGSDNINVGVNDDDSSKLKVTKDVFANIVRSEVEKFFSPYLTFERYDDNWNVCFEITDFQIQRRTAIKKLAESRQGSTAYLNDYKDLIVSRGGGIIGEISDVEIDQINEAAYMVGRVNKMYSFYTASFKELIDEYNKKFKPKMLK